ncbi:MAG: septum formation protein Maf [Chloroflexi bacterium]|nr:septum formation protein Maf [Chloroflexota bacterium]
MPSVNRPSQRPPPRLILASASPRRATLMREHGFAVEVIHPAVDERHELQAGEAPTGLAEALSAIKARNVAAKLEDGWILAGDTVVSLGNRVYGKPVDRSDARRILVALSGTTHQVITAVTLLDAATGAELTRHDTTAVTMKSLSDDELEAYLDTDAWRGKAGAFGIQDRGDPFVERIDGSFTNVVGFPMELVAAMLAAWGYQAG